jgi:hypothetical protein
MLDPLKTKRLAISMPLATSDGPRVGVALRLCSSGQQRNGTFAVMRKPPVEQTEATLRTNALRLALATGRCP